MLQPLAAMLGTPIPLSLTSVPSLRPPQPEECTARQNNYEITLSVLVLIGIIVSYIPQVTRIQDRRVGRCLVTRTND
jgi:hypothetical protein